MKQRVVNWLDMPLEDLSNCHKGIGVLKNADLLKAADFDTAVRFMKYMVLPPGTSIGEHKHGDNEEFYIILEGNGTMTLEEREVPVKQGHVVVNQPFGTHSLLNDSDSNMHILVLEVAKSQ